MQELEGLRVLSDQQCRARLGSSAVSPDMVCAGGEEGRDSCQATSSTDQLRGRVVATFYFLRISDPSSDLE